VVPFGTELEFDGPGPLGSNQQALITQIQTKHPRLVIFIGRLVSYKGIDVLIEAVGKIDADLIIIGQGPLKDGLVAKSQRLGLTNRVFFLGNVPREDVSSYLRAAKVLALPSISAAEAFGIVQIEAMAVGCPIVNTDLTTAVPHIARNGLEALTVRPQDPDELADALRTILDDPSLRARLSIGARKRAIAEYSADVFRARMEAIYHDVVTSRGYLR
jgi:rhamnosyl/mannosyltransferase